MNRNTYELGSGPGSRKTFGLAGMFGSLLVVIGVAATLLGNVKWALDGVLKAELKNGKAFSPLTAEFMSHAVYFVILVPVWIIAAKSNGSHGLKYVFNKGSFPLLVLISMLYRLAGTCNAGRIQMDTQPILAAVAQCFELLVVMMVVKVFRPDRRACHGAVLFSFLFAVGAVFVSIIEPTLKDGISHFDGRDASHALITLAIYTVRGIALGLFARYLTRFVDPIKSSSTDTSAEQVMAGQAPLLYYQQRIQDDESDTRTVNSAFNVVTTLLFIFNFLQIILIPLSVPILSLPMVGTSKPSISVEEAYHQFGDGFYCFEGMPGCDGYLEWFAWTTVSGFVTLVGTGVVSLQNPALGVISGWAGGFIGILMAGHLRHWIPADVGPDLTTHQDWQYGGAIAMALCAFVCLYIWEVNTIDGNADEDDGAGFHPHRLSGSYRNSTDGYGTVSKAAV